MKTRMGNVMLGAMLVILLAAAPGDAELSDGLMAHYPFNGNTNDETGNYPPLSVYGAIRASDRFGNPDSAYSFDGIDDYMAGPSYDVITPSAQGSFAVSFWFKPSTTWAPGDNPNSLIVGNFVTPSGMLDWGINTNIVWPEVLYFWWVSASPGELMTPPDTFNAGRWYHVVANYHAPSKNLSMWVDGILGSYTTMIDDIGDNLGGNNLAIARYEAEFADMAFDELRIYNRALEPSEIQQLAGAAPQTPAEQIQEILDIVNDSVAAGTLVGVGSGNSAKGKLNAFINQLEQAQDYIKAESYHQACHQLQDLLKKCDNQSPPPDTVRGTATTELAEKIGKLMDDICEPSMFAPVEVMTWVPPYVAKSSLIEVKKDFGTCGPKDGLTRVGLQFWVPRADGTIKYADHEWYTPTDADVAAWRTWCHSNGIKCLLCIYNNIGAWDWNLARSAFADTNNRPRFVSALVSKMDNLNLDGIDVDLEGLDPAILASDRNAFDQFIHDLSVQVRARGKILTVDTFSRTANAPSINWWVDWVEDVDNIHSMGYDDLYEGGTDLQKYSNQQAIGYLSGYDRDVVLMGMPAFKSSWGTSSGRGTSAQAHVQEVHYDLPEPTGIAIWSLQHLLVTEPPFGWSPWRNSDLWCEIKDLKGDD